MPLTDSQRASLTAQQQQLQQTINQTQQEISKIYQTMIQFAQDLGSYSATIFFNNIPSGVDQDDSPVTRKLEYDWVELDTALNLGTIAQKITLLRKSQDALGDVTKQLAAG